MTCTANNAVKTKNNHKNLAFGMIFVVLFLAVVLLLLAFGVGLIVTYRAQDI